MFWINLALLGIEAAIAVSLAHLVVKKPREKIAAFIILIVLFSIPFVILRHWIINPAIKTWFNQKDIEKRLAEVPSYKEVNQPDIERAHEYFYSGQYEKAVEYYLKALGSASDSKAELNYRIGLCHYMAGNLEESVKYWKEARSQAPHIFEHRNFELPTSSMAPTLIIGDYILCDIEYYRHRAPSRGDVVFFINPKQKDKIMIARIIGMPEEVIEIKGKEIYINNLGLPDEYGHLDGSKQPQSTLPEKPSPFHFGPVKVSKESYFVLGDNRNDSQGSIEYGPVHKDLFLGKALAIYASLAIKGKKESARPERVGKLIQ